MAATEKTIRVAILEADDPVPAISAQYGSYGGVFTSLLHKAADASGIPRSRVELSGWNVVDGDIAREGEEQDCGGRYGWKRTIGYPDLGAIDAVLVTGSKFNAFDNDAWVLRLVEFTKRALQDERVRVIGVCYGHQIVGRALGARVAKHERGTWEVSVCEVQQTERARELFGGKDVLSIMQMHKDIVCEYPPDVEPLGSSPTCKVQGMYVPKRLITVQGHPEFDAFMISAILDKRHEQGIFDDNMFAEAKSRASREQDGVLVAQAFLNMLLE